MTICYGTPININSNSNIIQFFVRATVKITNRRLTMRDKIKNDEYWNKVINRDLDRIKKFEEKLENNYVPVERIESVKETIEDIRFLLIQSMFSGGYSLKECDNYYKLNVSKAEKFINEQDSYVKLLWFISLGVLFNYRNKSLVTSLKNMVYQSKKDDKLINYMIHYLDSSWEITGNYFMKDPYELLDNVINADKQNAVKLLKDYLKNKWYRAHDEMDWYNSHKSKNDTYYGYWAFETGAIAKILKLDDTELKDIPYYPYDLVHYEE